LTPAFFRVNMKKNVADFISTLFHSSTVTHFMHLATDSYAVHKALGKYYPEIVELTDSYAETYSGAYEKIKDFPENFHNAKDPVKYLTSIKDYVYKNRKALPDDTELQNIVDEIAALIDSTLYRLTLQ
jgi:DNA-binding ferritin-like protein